MKKVYLAGPDVFRPDALHWARAARALCAHYGFEPLVPLDGHEVSPSASITAAQIYADNVAMITKADVVLANLNPFRGAEPDSGTCFEVGYAAALGKSVIAYCATHESMPERVSRCLKQTVTQTEAGWFDQEGWQIEHFDLPFNLMLAVPAQSVIGGLEEALIFLNDLEGRLNKA